MVAMIAVLLTIQLITVQGISLTTYRRQALCNLRDRINNNCFTLDTGKTKLDCASRCNSKPACKDFVFSSQDLSCYHNSSCTFIPSCSIFDSGLTFYTSELQAVNTPLQATASITETTREPTETTTAITETTMTPTETTAAPTEIITAPIETTMSRTETTPAPIETTMSRTEITAAPTETTMSRTETTPAPIERTMSRTAITAVAREIVTVQWTRTANSNINGDCQNGGIPTNFLCDCSTTGGWVGFHCESRPDSCNDLKYHDYPDGDYFVTLYPNGEGGNSFDAYCSIQGYSTLINLVRSSGNYNTSYPLSTYKSGFHLGLKDFWIGLDTMNTLTQSSSRSLTFTVHYSSSEFQGKAWVEYHSVTFSSTSSDAYRARQDFQFSTPGHDVQPFGTSTAGLIPDLEVIDFANSPNFAAPGSGDPSNCGNVGNRGWWYTTCGTTNPMGWNYKALPGATTSEHVLIPGVDMTQARVREAFDYFTVTMEDI